MHFVVTVQTFVLRVRDLKREVHHSVMHCANFVQKFVLVVLLNVKSLQLLIVVKKSLELAKNVQLNAVKCNQLKFPSRRVP